MIQNVINNAVRTDILVDPVRKAWLKSVPKKQKMWMRRHWKESGLQPSTVNQQPRREKCFFSFSFNSPDIFPHVYATL